MPCCSLLPPLDHCYVVPRCAAAARRTCSRPLKACNNMDGVRCLHAQHLPGHCLHMGAASCKTTVCTSKFTVVSTDHPARPCPQLSTKNYSSVRVVLVTASSAAPLSSSNATALQQAFCAAGASLQVVAFCPAGDAPADLQQLVDAINTQHRTADQHTPPCPSSLLEFPEPDEGAPLWQQLEPLSQCLDPRACSSSEERRSQSPLSSAEAALSTSARAQQTLRPAARPVQNTGVTRLARMLQPRHCRWAACCCSCCH
jgi:hypothetical protein